MRIRSTATLVVLLLATAGCGWTQWGGSQEHRGTSAFSGATPTTIAGWVSHTMSDVPASAPPAVTNGLVFHVADGRLRALDVNTDAVVWAADLPPGTVSGTAPATYGTGASATVFVTVSTPAAPVLLGFDVDRYRDRLRALHDRIRADGVFVSTAPRFLIELSRPAR